MGEILTGQITKLVEDRGFGFLARDGDDGPPFLFHRSVCTSAFADLRVGDRVTFERDPFAYRGPRCSRVVVVR